MDLLVSELVGDYPWSTILVDGVDVMTAQPGAPSRHAHPQWLLADASIDRSVWILRGSRRRPRQLRLLGSASVDGRLN